MKYLDLSTITLSAVINNPGAAGAWLMTTFTRPVPFYIHAVSLDSSVYNTVQGPPASGLTEGFLIMLGQDAASFQAPMGKIEGCIASHIYAVQALTFACGGTHSTFNEIANPIYVEASQPVSLYVDLPVLTTVGAVADANALIYYTDP